MCLALALFGIVYRYHQPYQLVRRDGSYYIILNPDQPETPLNGSNSSLNTMEAAPIVIFDSIAEMKSDIVTGKFTEEELEQIARFKTVDGKIQICSLDTLYEPLFPTSLFGNYRVHWSGTGYYFSLPRPNKPFSCAFFLRDKDFFDSEIGKLQNRTAYIDTGDKSADIQISHEEERNATVYSYTVYGYSADDVPVEKRECVYTFEHDGSTYYVHEIYELDSSDTIPTYIKIYAICNGQYIDISITSPNERPSVEWLSQFGLKEYGETSAS